MTQQSSEVSKPHPIQITSLNKIGCTTNSELESSIENNISHKQHVQSMVSFGGTRSNAGQNSIHHQSQESQSRNLLVKLKSSPIGSAKESIPLHSSFNKVGTETSICQSLNDSVPIAMSASTDKRRTRVPSSDIITKRNSYDGQSILTKEQTE